MSRRPPRHLSLVLIGAAALAIAPLPATAQSGRDGIPLAPLLNCRAMADASARLACFDREIDRAAGSAAPRAGAPAATAEALPRPRSALDVATENDVRAPNRGKPQPEGDTPAPKHFDAKIASVRAIQKADRWQFTLEDGTVWQTTEASASVSPHADGTVRLERAAFGSYFATFDGGRTLRSRRVK